MDVVTIDVGDSMQKQLLGALTEWVVHQNDTRPRQPAVLQSIQPPPTMVLRFAVEHQHG